MPLLAGLWAAGLLPARVLVGLGGLLVLLALVQGGRRAHELHRNRRLGEALLRAHPDSPPGSPLAAWRSAELTSARNRRRLTRHVRGLRRETEACLPSAALRLSVLEESAGLMQQLEARLGLLSEPVSPLGMLSLHALVYDDLSPLFFPEKAGALPAALSGTLAGLEPA